MKRKELIRANFEAYRDLEWAVTLLPKFRQYGIEEAVLAEFKKAWERHTEQRDWRWWQQHAEGYSDHELQADLAGCVERINNQSKDAAGSGELRFADMLAGKSHPAAEPEGQEQAQGRGSERER